MKLRTITDANGIDLVINTDQIVAIGVTQQTTAGDVCVIILAGGLPHTVYGTQEEVKKFLEDTELAQPMQSGILVH